MALRLISCDKIYELAQLRKNAIFYYIKPSKLSSRALNKSGLNSHNFKKSEKGLSLKFGYKFVI